MLQSPPAKILGLSSVIRAHQGFISHVRPLLVHNKYEGLHCIIRLHQPGKVLITIDFVGIYYSLWSRLVKVLQPFIW